MSKKNKRSNFGSYHDEFVKKISQEPIRPLASVTLNSRRSPEGFEQYVEHMHDEMRRLAGQSFNEAVARRLEHDTDTSVSYDRARNAVEKHILTATPDVAWDDIIGNEKALTQLKDAIEAPVTQKELYQYYEMTMPKGALLSGPPGCGKTMFAKAAASEMARLYGSKVDFISLSGGELQTRYVGETEAKIKALFTFAREYKKHHGHPLIIFIDEAEVILPDRTGRVRPILPWEESQVSVFLSEMDGMEECGAFVLLATNRPEVIDQAVLRDGRCDFKIKIEKPSKDAIQQIVLKNLANTPTQESLEDLAFAAVETFFNPDFVLDTAVKISAEMKIENGEKELDFNSERVADFTFDKILSGAMAASVPARAKRYAFARDKASGKPSGVTTGDIISSVTDLFNENRNLDHSYARSIFMDELRDNALKEGD